MTKTETTSELADWADSFSSACFPYNAKKLQKIATELRWLGEDLQCREGQVEGMTIRLHDQQNRIAELEKQIAEWEQS